jgi:hypothetical protein
MAVMDVRGLAANLWHDGLARLFCRHVRFEFFLGDVRDLQSHLPTLRHVHCAVFFESDGALGDVVDHLSSPHETIDKIHTIGWSLRGRGTAQRQSSIETVALPR